MWLLAFTGAVSLPVDHLLGAFWHSCGGTSASLQSFTPQGGDLWSPAVVFGIIISTVWGETTLGIFIYLLKTIIHQYDPTEAPQHIWVHIFRFGFITRRFVVYLGKVLVLDQTGSVGLVFGVVDGGDSHWTFLFHKYKCRNQKTVKTTKRSFVYDMTSFWSETRICYYSWCFIFLCRQWSCCCCKCLCVCSEF